MQNERKVSLQFFLDDLDKSQREGEHDHKDGTIDSIDEELIFIPFYSNVDTDYLYCSHTFTGPFDHILKIT
jgi:hypothetical protein